MVPEGGGQRSEFRRTWKKREEIKEQLFFCSFEAGLYVLVCYSSGNVARCKSLRSRQVTNDSAGPNHVQSTASPGPSGEGHMRVVLA